MKHYVRVCRPRFEVVVIEVDASNHTEAEGTAAELADAMPDEQWTLLQYDGECYFPHIEHSASEAELRLGCSTDVEKERAVAKMLKPAADHSVRYLLLKGSTYTGEGELIGQPWFRGDQPELLERDIAGDWIQQLEAITQDECFDYSRWNAAWEDRVRSDGDHVKPHLFARLLKSRKGESGA